MASRVLQQLAQLYDANHFVQVDNRPSFTSQLMDRKLESIEGYLFTLTLRHRGGNVVSQLAVFTSSEKAEMGSLELERELPSKKRTRLTPGPRGFSTYWRRVVEEVSAAGLSADFRGVKSSEDANGPYLWSLELPNGLKRAEKRWKKFTDRLHPHHANQDTASTSAASPAVNTDVPFSSSNFPSSSSSADPLITSPSSSDAPITTNANGPNRKRKLETPKKQRSRKAAWRTPLTCIVASRTIDAEEARSTKRARLSYGGSDGRRTLRHGLSEGNKLRAAFTLNTNWD